MVFGGDCLTLSGSVVNGDYRYVTVEMGLGYGQDVVLVDRSHEQCRILTLIFSMGKTGMKSRAWREKELWCEHGSGQVWERVSERVGKWCCQSRDHCMWTI